MAHHIFVLPTEVSSVQEPPESVEVHKEEGKFVLNLFVATAHSFVPSPEEAMDCHCFVLPTEVSSVQVPPELVEVHKFPYRTPATSFSPLAEEATQIHFFDPAPAEDQESPESVEVHNLPPSTAATSFSPLSEEATEPHTCLLPTEVSSVQELPELVEVHKLPFKGDLLLS